MWNRNAQIRSYEPKRLNADVIGWNCHSISRYTINTIDKQTTYGANADGVTIRVSHIEVSGDGIERVDWEVDSAKVEADIEHLVARYQPQLRLGVILGTLNAAIYRIRHGT